MTATTSVRRSSSPAPVTATSYSSTESAGGGQDDSYTRSDVLRYAGRVVEDVTVIDKRAAEGDDFGVASRLSLLQGDFEDLASSGVPPGLDRAHYKATVSTLASFCEQGGEDYDAGDMMQMEARYQVIREHSAQLLREINGVYGSHLHF